MFSKTSGLKLIYNLVSLYQSKVGEGSKFNSPLLLQVSLYQSKVELLFL